MSDVELVDNLLEDLLNELAEPGRGDLLVCRICRAAVTRDSEQIPVNGAGVHRFTNVAGVTFDIACFGQAPGCSISGSATQEYTWFCGYSWQFAHCTECGEHLGWYFENRGDHSFFGLIIAQLLREAG